MIAFSIESGGNKRLGMSIESLDCEGLLVTLKNKYKNKE